MNLSSLLPLLMKGNMFSQNSQPQNQTQNQVQPKNPACDYYPAGSEIDPVSNQNNQSQGPSQGFDLQKMLPLLSSMKTGGKTPDLASILSNALSSQTKKAPETDKAIEEKNFQSEIESFEKINNDEKT